MNLTILLKTFPQRVQFWHCSQTLKLVFVGTNINLSLYLTQILINLASHPSCPSSCLLTFGRIVFDALLLRDLGILTKLAFSNWEHSLESYLLHVFLLSTFNDIQVMSSLIEWISFLFYSYWFFFILPFDHFLREG